MKNVLAAILCTILVASIGSCTKHQLWHEKIGSWEVTRAFIRYDVDVDFSKTCYGNWDTWVPTNDDKAQSVDPTIARKIIDALIERVPGKNIVPTPKDLTPSVMHIDLKDGDSVRIYFGVAQKVMPKTLEPICWFRWVKDEARIQRIRTSSKPLDGDDVYGFQTLLLLESWYKDVDDAWQSMKK